MSGVSKRRRLGRTAGCGLGFEDLCRMDIRLNGKFGLRIEMQANGPVTRKDIGNKTETLPAYKATDKKQTADENKTETNNNRKQ